MFAYAESHRGRQWLTQSTSPTVDFHTAHTKVTASTVHVSVINWKWSGLFLLKHAVWLALIRLQWHNEYIECTCLCAAMHQVLLHFQVQKKGGKKAANMKWNQESS